MKEIKITHLFDNEKFVKSPQNLIRIGSPNDGGYILTRQAVLDSSFLISGGVGSNLDFEYDFNRINPKPKIHLIDKSNSYFINFFLKAFYLLLFRKFSIVSFEQLFKFHSIKDSMVWYNCFINSDNSISKFLVKAQKEKKNKGYLKLDIEGSEWEILDDILENDNAFLGYSIEFHNADINIEKLKNFISKSSKKIAFIAINEACGIGNNEIPKMLEISFLDEYYISWHKTFNQHLKTPNQIILETLIAI